jgi:alpha-L-rhamnosidase
MLEDGENALGVLLGGGWYTQMDSNEPRGQLVALLSIKYRSGQIQSVVTDGSWHATQGWIVYDSVFNGERYDARLEIPGWNEPNQKFDCASLRD